MEKALPSFEWFSPTRVLFGCGRLGRLPSTVDEFAGSRARVFLVTGKRSLRAGGILERVVEAIGPRRVTLFDKVSPYPSPKLADAAVAECRDASADIVVGIGGGSALDVAKLVAAMVSNEGNALDYASGRRTLQRQGLPFIALPTTSGSTAETNPAAALWEMETRENYVVSSPLMFPNVAIVDPELSMSMPKSVVAATGMDVFTAAFESYWSSRSQPISDAMNLEVIRLCATNLKRSCNEADPDSRTLCALAATISGVAYSASPPNACHGVSFPLTMFWDAAHGQATSITLTTFLKWNAGAIDNKLPALWAALGVEGVDQAVRLIDRMMETCGLQTRLGGLGVTEKDMDTILDNVSWRRLEMAARPSTREDLRGLLLDLI